MVICIQKGLEGLKRELEKRGHNVKYYDCNNHTIDIYIYAGKAKESNLMITVENAILTANLKYGTKKHVEIIDCIDKSVEEIEQLIYARHNSANLRECII